MENTGTGVLDIEKAVLDRYAQGARQVQPALCCPGEYDPAYLKALPEEILEKDYGCGDPSRYVRAGETVVDLGSGAGKICYILAQKVGPKGQVIGIDFNDEMLALARQYQDEVATKLGYANTHFLKGRIQDLALPLDKTERWLARHPIHNLDELTEFENECLRLRRDEPMVADESVDVVVSNCVLNLVRQSDRTQLFAEIYRVLRRGGRAVISDIVCDEDATTQMQNDSKLWSGCISGAFREDRLLSTFEHAGFYGIEILSRQEEPWQVIEGIEFRSMTVCAVKGKEGPCLERNQAVVYRGPWKRVVDDDGHTLHRGQRMAVCDKTYRIYTSANGPYASDVIAIEPYNEVPLEQAPPFSCSGTSQRHPKQTKGEDYAPTVLSEDGPCCETDECC